MELDAIVPIAQENVELFRIFWPPDPLLVQARPGPCLVVMVRHAAGGGLLVAMPSALVPLQSSPPRQISLDRTPPWKSLGSDCRTPAWSI